MLTTLTIGALAVIAGIQETDTTFAVGNARLLELENAGGQVVVRTWDRNEMRVQADHSRRTVVEIDIHDDEIRIEPDGTMGPATVVDFQITVPRGMSIQVEGMYTDLDVDGLQGDVNVETLEGTILLKNIQGSIRAEAVNAEVRIENVQGDVDVESVARGVFVTGVQGEVRVESVSGSIQLMDVRSRRVNAGTVSGRITFDGAIADDGEYLFGAHSGQIVLALPEGVNARVSVTSLSGGFVGRYPGTPEELDTRRRGTFSLGSGSAYIEAETFSGDVVIRRRGDPETEEELAWSASGHRGDWGAGVDLESAHLGMEAGMLGLEAGMAGMEAGLEAMEAVLSGMDMETFLDFQGLEGLENLNFNLNLNGLNDLEGLEEQLEQLEALGPEIRRQVEKSLERKRHN